MTSKTDCSTKCHGVGIIGTGLAFQAIHARVLANLASEFAIRVLWDSDGGRADEAAAWLGARAATSCDDLLADPAVEVVVIASPARFHAGQALAAMRAGKRVVLVEKPLCVDTDEALALAAEAKRCGAALLVGTMHRHDPAWQAAEKILVATGFAPGLVRSSIVLPPNGRFEEWTTEPLSTLAGNPGTPPPAPGPEHMMRMCIMELAIHDLPLVRRLLPAGASPRVLSARLRKPLGYAVSLIAADVLVDLSGMLQDHWQTDWTLEATGREGHLRIEFTPSFVSAGSGAMTWSNGQQTLGHEPSATNGYQDQWKAIAAILRGEIPVPDPLEAVEDIRFAISIAEQASRLLTAEVQS